LKEEEIRLQIEKNWAKHLRIDYEVLRSKPFLLVVDEEKRGTLKLSVFTFVDRTVVSCDPEVKCVIEGKENSFRLRSDEVPSSFGKSFRVNRKTSIKYLNPSNYVPFDPPDDFVVRRVNHGDKKAFYDFRSYCTREDLIEGYVELDHVAVFGAFFNSEIVAVSSIIEWNGIADIGIITMPEFRDLGLGKALGSKSSEWGILNNRLVQYRHDVLNYGSLKVSRALGFREYAIEHELVYVGGESS